MCAYQKVFFFHKALSRPPWRLRQLGSIVRSESSCPEIISLAFYGGFKGFLTHCHSVNVSISIENI
jgi:hypothetical protein